jgi:hypothetical protein
MITTTRVEGEANFEIEGQRGFGIALVTVGILAMSIHGRAVSRNEFLAWTH